MVARVAMIGFARDIRISRPISLATFSIGCQTPRRSHGRRQPPSSFPTVDEP